MKKEKVLNLRAMQTAGATVGEIAKKLRLNPEDVEAKLIELGYTPNVKVTPEPHSWGNSEKTVDEKLKKSRITAEKIETVLIAYDNGMKVTEIARQLDRAQSSVSRIVAKYRPNLKEKEPEATAIVSSSQLSKDNNNLTHPYYNALKSSCQVAFDFADQSCKDILGIYENMTNAEQKAFDLGSVYLSTLYARNELESVLMKEGEEDGSEN